MKLSLPPKLKIRKVRLKGEGQGPVVGPYLHVVVVVTIYPLAHR
jgi:hypothetical protein